MSTEPFIGEVKAFGFNFAPIGYHFCNGQLLPISTYTALFALIGTTYGGNGQTTFALPDLRGRIPIGQGKGPGLNNYVMGEVMGTETTTLLMLNLPAHVHDASGLTVSVPVSNALGEDTSPVNNYLAASATDFYASAPTGGSNLGTTILSGMTGVSGNNNPTNIQQPILTMNFSMALEGIFPSRS